MSALLIGYMALNVLFFTMVTIMTTVRRRRRLQRLHTVRNVSCPAQQPGTAHRHDDRAAAFAPLSAQ